MRPSHLLRCCTAALAALLLSACANTPAQNGDPCGAPYVAGTFAYSGSCTGDGWYDWTADLGSGDDGSSSASGDDSSGSGDDGSSVDDGSSSGNDGSSSVDDGSSSGDDGSSSSGDDGSSSGDDGTDMRRLRAHKHHAKKLPVTSLKTAIASQAPVVAADANGCYACPLTCVLASPPAGVPNAATAVGSSDTSYAAACGDANGELASWAQGQGTTLKACRTGAGGP